MSSPRELALLAAEAMEAKQADEVVILELTRFTPIADYFVIASGQSPPQLRAIADAVEEAMEAREIRLRHREGDEHARWVLLDFGAVIVHLFRPEARRFYQLEGLWADAPILER